LNSRIFARTAVARTVLVAPDFYRQTGNYRKTQIFAAISARFDRHQGVQTESAQRGPSGRN
jgi:hypothetical protein